MIDVANRGKGQDRLDAIAALGRAPTSDSDEALRALAFSEDESEDVRRAAYRSLRRLMRIKAAESRVAEARRSHEKEES